MKLHSVTDIITNSSSVTFIYPIDNAVEATQKMLGKFMSMMGLQGKVEDIFDIHIEPSDDWYWNAFWQDTDNAREFLAAKNMELNEFHRLENRDEQASLIKEFKIQARQDYLDGKLDFDFDRVEAWEFWPRYLDVIITNKNGDIINLNNEVLEIYNPGELVNG